MDSRTPSLLTLTLTLTLSACSNYTFRYGPYGRVDVGELAEALQQREDGHEVPRLQEAFWIPLVYMRLTRFQRTSPLLEPGFPVEGYTLSEMRGIGPVAILWTSSKVDHYTDSGEFYHGRARHGIVHRLAATYSHYVATERGRFSFHELELLFGLIKGQGEGFPRRLGPVHDVEIPLGDDFPGQPATAEE